MATNGSRMAVFKSTDDGGSWLRMYLSPENGEVHALAPQPSNKSVILAGGWTYDASWYRYSRMYRSTDGGSSWAKVGGSTFGNQNDYLHAIAWDPFNANRVLAVSFQGVYVSSDAGVTWTGPGSWLGTYDIVADPGRANTFYAATYNGVQVSTNGGTSWTQMNSGLTTLNVERLSLDPVNRRLFAATQGDGVYRYGLLTDVKDDPGPGEVPARFVLYQNYPNPFNPATTITFGVPVGGEYQMSVYDALGREVAQLLTGTVAPGEHTVRFDGSGLASGVYLVRLSGIPGVLSRQISLIR